MTITVYKPAICSDHQATDQGKLIMRDRDMDNDKLPDAWEWNTSAT